MRMVRRGRESGQGMTEYILIVALVAVLTITVVTVFGKQLRSMFMYATGQISGDSSAKMNDHSSEDDGQDTKDLSSVK